MRRSVPAAALALAVVLAGCLAGGNVDPSSGAGAANAVPFLDPMGQDHDHSDPALHDFNLGFELLHHEPLGDEATSAGVHALDVKAGYLFAAVYGDTVGAHGGFFVFDLADPTAPKAVGRYRFAGAMGGDRSMEATADGNFVVLGTEAVDCAGHVNPFGPGLYLVDVTDKTAPRLAHYLPTMGVHSVAVHAIGGDDYVFSVTSPGGIFRIERTPAPRLVQVAEFGFGHDIIVQDDPVLDKPVLYAADGGGPLNIYDVSDPARPQLLATWNIPDRGDKFYVHTAAAEVRPDGRRIVVVTSEDWGDDPSPLWVLDATRFDVVETLATWQNPGAHAAEGLRYSLHNPRMRDGSLTVAHYHGGVWTLDLAAPEAPVVKGFYLPHEGGTLVAPARTSTVADRLCGAFHLGDAPSTFDVELGEGVVYAADLHTGIYALRPPA